VGVLSFIFQKISALLSFFGQAMPKFKIDYGLFGKSLNVLKPHLDLANTFFPVEETMTVIKILVSFGIFMFVLWTIQRLINLIRGAG